MQDYQKLLALRNKVKVKSAGSTGLRTDLLLSNGKPVEKPQTIGVPEISSSEVEYEEANLLGEGAYGKVYLGTCRGQQVAVKVLKRNLDPKVVKEFRQEVQLLSQIFHPNVCLFMGACFEDGNMMIITELLALGDMQGMLYDKKLKLSLFTRLRMALDAAKGMCWLHFGKQAVIHRDLKPGNFLVDANLNVKVCDFGLSQLLPNEDLTGETTLRDPKGRIKGSPLWMAPEVLKGEPFNTKADVYAFGIVLWEMIAKKKPYSHIKTLAQLRREVCIQNVRPQLPDKLPESLQKLYADLVAPNPADRPDFKQVVSRIETVLVDLAIEDQKGREFWMLHFKGQREAPWQEFINALDSFTGEDGADDEQSSACLRAILELPAEDQSAKVHIEVFGKVLCWLGPLDDGKFYSRLTQLLSQHWFHGNTSTREAERVLEGRGAGAFLIRFSTRQPGSYTISKMQKDGKKTHQRIERKRNKFRVNHHSYPSLEKVLEGEYTALELLTACPGSQYRAIFDKGAADIGSNYQYNEASSSSEEGE